MHVPVDLMLILERDGASLELLRSVAGNLGCNFIEASGPAALADLLVARPPTIAVLAVDCLEADGLDVLQLLVQRGSHPVTLLVGSLNTRVLASVERAARARGLPIIGIRARPLDQADLERLLSGHLGVPPPIAREEVERALAELEFTLRYQPKIALGAEGLKIQGVEALVRWKHPRRGELEPRHFLGAVETHGFLSSLTDFVIMEAIRQASVWRAQGMPLEMVVNLSPRLVRDRAFPDRLSALLHQHDYPAEKMVIDLTEATSAEDEELMLDVFTRLRILGVGLALDNFGTGVSSFTQLYRLPFSEVKVDRTLLIDVVRERDAELIVRAIADLAHALEMTVCAQGVETTDMLDFVRAVGFDTAQGRLFCGPVLPHEIERLVLAWPGSAPLATGTWQAIRLPGSDKPSITRRMRRLRLASRERPHEIET